LAEGQDSVAHVLAPHSNHIAAPLAGVYEKFQR
jgi:hypothetical protein